MALPTQIEERLRALGVRVADVEEKFVRGTGPGGQKINKTSSTVWLRHGPTGVEVRCQRERSQAVNREVAWAELCAKLEARTRVAKAAVVDAREEARRRTRHRRTARRRSWPQLATAPPLSWMRCSPPARMSAAMASYRFASSVLPSNRAVFASTVTSS